MTTAAGNSSISSGRFHQAYEDECAVTDGVSNRLTRLRLFNDISAFKQFRVIESRTDFDV
jgi:hypothetical protein